MGTFARSGLMEVLKCCCLIVFLQIAGNVNLANGEGLDVSSEGELVEKLLSNYHKHGRPVLDASKPIVVTLGATLQHIQKVDSKEETITSYMWLNFEWKDEFLAWNSSQAQGIDKLRLDVGDIWIPDIEVYNLVSRRGLREKEQVVLESSGSIFWIPPYILTTTCKLDHTWFPFDEQSCDIKFGSWAHNGWSIDIQVKKDLSGHQRLC